MTQFLADESCDALIVRTLRALGHDVLYIAEQAPSETDASILNQGHQQQRIIITEDRDFCELVYRDVQPTYGIVLVRIAAFHRAKKADQITTLVNEYRDELSGAMTTVKLRSIKVRPIMRGTG